MIIETPSMDSQKISLKVLVDKKGQRVLLAEAPKEFVDFLFHIFSLPLGIVAEFLGSEETVGSLGKLKESIDSLNETYLQPGIKKDDDIFNPKTPIKNPFLLPYDSSSVDDECKAIYRCSNASPYCFSCRRETSQTTVCLSHATMYEDSTCPDCRGWMYTEMKLVVPEEVAAAIEKKKIGYVKELVTYMVMDDLVVKPMSTILSIALIKNFGVEDLSQLEDKTVSFGRDEALKLLKASLTTDRVLTTQFLHTNDA